MYIKVQYQDAEVCWFRRLVEKELWLYRSLDSGIHELSSLIDQKKWKRRRAKAEESSKK